MSLSRQLESEFDYEGTLIKLNIAFNNVLLYYQLNMDDDFDYNEKVDIAFNLLVDNDKKVDKSLTLADKADILKTINSDFLTDKSSKAQSGGKKAFDFEQDAKYIYSSFMKEYGIDLYNEIDQLDWRKFIWLLHGLGEDTKLQKIIDIRMKPIPKRTKHNTEYIKSLLESKTKYALEMDDKEREKQFADSLKTFVERITGKKLPR